MSWNIFRNLDKVNPTAHGSRLTAHGSRLTLKLGRKFQKIKSLFVIPSFLSVIPAKAGIYTNKSPRSPIPTSPGFAGRGRSGMTRVRLPRPSLRSLLAMTLLFSMILNSLFIFPASVYAASTPWTQTDWSGGVGASTTNQYSAASSTDATTTAGQVTLTNTEKLSNTGFESNLTGWNTGVQPDSISGLQLWLKADAITGLSDGDAVTTWTDSSGNGNNATQSTTAEKPTYKTSIINSQPVVRFDGSNDTLSTTTYTRALPQHIFTVLKFSSATGNKTAFDSATTTNNCRLFQDPSFNATLNLYSGAPLGVSFTPVNGSFGIVTALCNGASSALSTNGATPTTGDSGTAITTGVRLGAAGSGGAFFPGDFAEMIVFDSALSDSNRQSIEAYLQEKYGVSSGYATLTRDTTTTYSGSAGSAKLVTGSNATAFNQSVNVGDTNTYNLSAYAYTDGSAVTSSDVELFYNGSTISTTYTSAGSGWYKLTGTLTGANASRVYGVQVAANKTVYVDDFSLNSYASSGTLTSSIFDSGQGSNWGTLTYIATTPTDTTATVKVRTSNSSSMTGATAFASCSAISSGADISSNSCVTDTNQYVQYQIALANTSVEVTPTFTSFSLAFSSLLPTAPSSFSGSASGTTSINWSWTDNASNETGFYVQDNLGNTKCTAIANATTCNEGSLSPNTSYTRVVLAYNGSGNSGSSNSASATTRSIPSPSLSSPGNNTYINNSRPSFTFQPSTTNTATSTYNDVSSYRLYVKDTTGNTVFSISGIPTSGTTQINNASYTISFSGFNDSDTGNNYITVQTKGSSSWGNQGKYNTSNNGNLIQGQQTWSVASVDSAGNESASNNTIYLDNTAPTVTLTSIGNISFNTKYQNWYYTQLNPTFTGSSSEQGTVTITLNKKGFNTSVFGGYGNYITANVNTDSSGNFSWTPSNLEYGEYQVIIQSKDQAGNTSQTLNFNLIVDTYQNLVNQGIFQDSQSKPTSSEQTETPEQQEPEVIQTKEGGPIIPKEPNALEKATSVIPDLIGNLYKSGTAWIPTFVGMTGQAVSSVFNSIGNGIAFVFDKTVQDIAFRFNMTTQGIAFVFNKTGEGLAFVSSVNTSINGAIFHNIEIATSAIGNGLYTVTNNIGQGYSNLANNAPGVTKNVLLALGNGVSTVGTGIGNGFGAVGTTTHNIADGTSSVIASGSEAISNTGKIATSSVRDGLLAMTKGAQNGITSIAFAVGEKVQDVSGTVGIAIIKFTYNFVPEPTKISDVKVLVLSPTSVKVTWLTNHPANGKVNYGLDRTYPFDVQTEKRTNNHEFILTNLQADTTYLFEVMSQNKNYVYDANREFRTPKK